MCVCQVSVKISPRMSLVVSGLSFPPDPQGTILHTCKGQREPGVEGGREGGRAEAAHVHKCVCAYISGSQRASKLVSEQASE